MQRSTVSTASRRVGSHTIKQHHSSHDSMSALQCPIPSLEKRILAAEDRLGSTAAAVMIFPVKEREINCDFTPLVFMLILRARSANMRTVPQQILFNVGTISKLKYG